MQEVSIIFFLLLFSGFERVAEEFMGRRQWRVYQERVLKSWCPSIERDIEVKDWDPTEDKCNFCDLEPTGRDTDEETVSTRSIAFLFLSLCLTLERHDFGPHFPSLPFFIKSYRFISGVFIYFSLFSSNLIRAKNVSSSRHLSLYCDSLMLETTKFTNNEQKCVLPF